MNAPSNGKDYQHYKSTPIDRLIACLDSVKQTGNGRWIARCPAHDDKRPSLTIKETNDGTILLKCWAGCCAGDVVAAVGLSLGDLFPTPLPNRGPLRKGERWAPADVWICLSFEAAIAAQAAADIATGLELSPEDVRRVAQAALRLDDAAAVMGASR